MVPSQAPSNSRKLDNQESRGQISLSRQRFSERALRSTSKLDFELRKKLVQLKLVGNSRIKGIDGGNDGFTLYDEILVDNEDMANSQETFQGKQVQFKGVTHENHISAIFLKTSKSF